MVGKAKAIVEQLLMSFWLAALQIDLPTSLMLTDSLDFDDQSISS